MMKDRRIIWIVFILLSYFNLTYIGRYGWWFASMGSVLIILFSYFAWPDDFRERIGLRLNKRQIFLSILSFPFFLLGSYKLIRFIGATNNTQLIMGQGTHFLNDFFRTFNEEMIAGGLILLSLKRKYNHSNPIWISLTVAFIFCLMHYVLYRWVFIWETGILTSTTLFSLFVIGALRNNLILGAGHIGYAWALHFSWTAIMFGCKHFQLDKSEELSQTARFNLFFGDKLTVAVSSILALLSFILLRTKGKLNPS